jgi:hypothetical protein
MKKIILNLFFVIIAASFIACDNDYKDDNESYLDDREPVTYFASSSYTLLVRENEENLVEVNIGSSDVSNVDRSYSVSIDNSSTAVDNVDYTASLTNLTIPAGKNFGVITVNAGDFANATVNGRTLVLNLNNVDDSVISTRLTCTITIIKFCPIEADFTGSFLIEQLTPFVDGPTLSDGTVVEVINVAGSATQRSFLTANYADYCDTPNEFIFDLVCGQVLLPNNRSNCSCGENLFFTNADIPSTYNPADDSTFELTFTDDAFTDCGDPVQTTYRFTKQ